MCGVSKIYSKLTQRMFKLKNVIKSNQLRLMNRPISSFANKQMNTTTKESILLDEKNKEHKKIMQYKIQQLHTVSFLFFFCFPIETRQTKKKALKQLEYWLG